MNVLAQVLVCKVLKRNLGTFNEYTSLSVARTARHPLQPLLPETSVYVVGWQHLTFADNACVHVGKRFPAIWAKLLKWWMSRRVKRLTLRHVKSYHDATHRLLSLFLFVAFSLELLVAA